MRGVATVIPNYTPGEGATSRYYHGAARVAPPRSVFMRQPAVRAPEFPEGLDWIHTGGRPLTLADFRGKILLLDFWTYG